MPLSVQQLLVSFGCGTVIVALPTLALLLAGIDPELGLVLLCWLGAGLVVHRWLWSD